MLELRCNESPSGLGGMVAIDARLSVALQLVERDGDGGAMRLAYPVITANERGERRGFRSGKGRVPTSPVLDRLGCGAIGIGILLGRPMAD